MYVSISLSLVVIRLGLIEVLLKWHHILINVDYIFSIFNIHTRVASRYSNDYITTQIETPFYMVMETLEWAPDFSREIQVARMLTDTGLSRKAYEKLEKMFKERDLETGWWHASRILSDWRQPYRTWFVLLLSCLQGLARWNHPGLKEGIIPGIDEYNHGESFKSNQLLLG